MGWLVSGKTGNPRQEPLHDRGQVLRVGGLRRAVAQLHEDVPVAAVDWFAGVEPAIFGC